MKTPEFKNLKEERTSWDTHDATDYPPLAKGGWGGFSYKLGGSHLDPPDIWKCAEITG